MILVDLHEPKSILQGLGEIGCRVHLEVGDYQFFSLDKKRVIVERKAISDLLNSISSGRLQGQVRNTISLADVPILLVEGFITSTKEGKVRHKSGVSNWNYTAVQNFLVTAQLSGMYIVSSPNLFLTSRVLLGLFSYFQKEEHRSLKMRTKPTILYPSGDRERRVDLLSVIPGIGPGLAGRLLERFEMPIEVFMASDEMLLEVEGVGKKRIEMIRRTVGTSEEETR